MRATHSVDAGAARVSPARRPTADVQTLLGFYRAGRTRRRRLRLGIERGLRRMLAAPGFLFRVEREPLDQSRPGDAAYASAPTSSSRRGCRSSCGAAFPTRSCSTRRCAARCSDPAVLEQQVRRMLRDPRVAGARRQLRRSSGCSCGKIAGVVPGRRRVSRLRREPARGDAAGDRAVRRQPAPRGSQRGRSADRRTTRSSTSGWRAHYQDSRTSTAAASAA